MQAIQEMVREHVKMDNKPIEHVNGKASLPWPTLSKKEMEGHKNLIPKDC